MGWWLLSSDTSCPVRPTTTLLVPWAAIEPFDEVERWHQADDFAGGAWWAGSQIESTSPARFDPNMGRFLAKIRSTLS
jgi:hypothetical protein